MKNPANTKRIVDYLTQGAGVALTPEIQRMMTSTLRTSRYTNPREGINAGDLYDGGTLIYRDMAQKNYIWGLSNAIGVAVARHTKQFSTSFMDDVDWNEVATTLRPQIESVETANA